MSDQNDTARRGEILRKLADVLDAHPEIDMPDIDAYDGYITNIRFQFTSHGDRAAEASALAMKAMPGKFTKGYGGEYFTLHGSFEGVPVNVNTMRADVCVAREVGTEMRMVKDPEALKTVPEIPIEVPVYEYDCKPILGQVAA